MIKTLTFAATHFTVAFGVAYALTGDLALGGALALLEPAINTVAYYVHERIWTRVRAAPQTTETASLLGPIGRSSAPAHPSEYVFRCCAPRTRDRSRRSLWRVCSDPA